MSQPPYQPPPGSPAGPGWGEPPGPPPKNNHMVELVVGSVLGGIDVVVSLILGVAGLAATYDSGTAGWGLFVGPGLGLLVPLLLLISARTRWWGIGMLIGIALTLIIGGGACASIIYAA